MDIEVLAFEKLAELRAIEILEELQKEASTLGGAALGAATGATAGALSTKDKEKRLRRALIGGALGTAGGAATGHALGSLRQVKKLRQDIRGRGKDLYTRAKEVLETEGKTKKAAGFQRLQRLAKAEKKGKDVAGAMRGAAARDVHKAKLERAKTRGDREFDAIVKKEFGPNVQLGQKFTIPHPTGPAPISERLRAFKKRKARLEKQSSDEIELLAMAELAKIANDHAYAEELLKEAKSIRELKEALALAAKKGKKKTEGATRKVIEAIKGPGDGPTGFTGFSPAYAV